MCRRALPVGLVALAALSFGCSGTPDAESQSTTTSVAVRQPINIIVELGEAQPIVGPVEVAILDEDGTVVAQTTFESGWVIPEEGFTCRADEERVETGAATELHIGLPQPGTYTFDVTPVIVGTPCTLNMEGYRGGKHELTVSDGDRHDLPIGQLDWIS